MMFQESLGINEPLFLTLWVSGWLLTCVDYRRFCVDGAVPRWYVLAGGVALMLAWPMKPIGDSYRSSVSCVKWMTRWLLAPVGSSPSILRCAAEWVGLRDSSTLGFLAGLLIMMVGAAGGGIGELRGWSQDATGSCVLGGTIIGGGLMLICAIESAYIKRSKKGE